MLQRDQLHTYQREIVDHVKAGAESLLFVEVGLGKTVSVLTALEDIRAEDRAIGKRRRALVVAPKRVATSVWAQEAKRWSHLQHVKVGVAIGSPAYRLKVLTDPKYDVVTINYENLPWLCDKFPRKRLGDHFYFLVMDEVDKMKDPGSKRFRRFRYRVDEFEMRIGMTGTPVSEGLMDVWGPSFLVTCGKALGTSHQGFKRRYFESLDPQGWNFAPRDGAVDEIARRLNPYVYRARAADHLDLPPIIHVDRFYDLPPKARVLYDQFERDMALCLAREHLDDEYDYSWMDDREDEVELEAANAAVLKNKLRQICSGFNYIEQGGTRNIAWLHREKFEATSNLQSELMGQQLLIVYGFRAEYQNLKLDGRLGGGIKDSDAARYIDEWNAGKLRTLGMHPASAGHGLNLHMSGAHNIAFLTLPWSRALYDQTIGRLHRMGQKQPVFVHRFIAKDTVEEVVLGALESKGSVQKRVIEAIRGRHGL